MSNPFESWAEAAKPQWQQRQEARERRRKAKLAEVMAEKAELRRRYQAVKDEDRARLLAGPYGKQLGELIGYLDQMRPGDGAALVRYVLDWLPSADVDLHFEALHLISGAIVSLRESQGLPPFDDPLPWDSKSSAFLKLREILAGQVGERL